MSDYVVQHVVQMLKHVSWIMCCDIRWLHF